ncbi:MAG TPA: asparagine--tRNA ligase [Candidatus Acidoferrales bacterium]|nr:asparagine--tRNA ligase [Candidatus Acidoferrales bacterium]
MVLRGWLHHIRSSGGILFLQLRDGTGVIQCTLKKDKIDAQEFERLATTAIESTIEVAGEVKKDPRAPRGYELQGEKVTILYPAAEDYPIARKYHGPDFLLDHRHLWIRNEKMQTLFRVRSRLIDEARKWLSGQGYLEVQVPILVNAAVEGGSTLFPVKYFDEKAYLSQSWQLYAEAMITSVGKIFTLAPSFRAEKSRTRRHLTEYWHLEVEAPWMDVNGLMELEEELVTHMCQQISQYMPEELKSLGRKPEQIANVKPPFPRITYDKAVEYVQESMPNFKWGKDMGYEEEKVLTQYFQLPFFVNRFPKGIKAFYHMPDPENPKVTLSVDLLAPEGYGEITGGGQRIHDLQQLLTRIKEEGLKADDYKWYIELRKYGTVPHSGFGMGVERILAWICGLEHIRDAIAFPRLINRIYP